MAPQEKVYARFSIAQRLEHWVMAISFTVLGATGLPQSYPLTTWAQTMIEGMGGIETVRIIHRIAAVIFILSMIYHFIAVAYKIFVMRVRMTMLPTLQDAKDMVDALRYYLGLTEEHPKYPRYNYAEKMEYWAVIWGGVLMAVTGFMLWNPIATTSFLPGQVVPAARAAHSAEALLAILAIIIWHVYWVHVKTFNKAIFTGYLTREQMKEEHGAELEAIEAGVTTWFPPEPEVKQKRMRVFTPFASIAALVMVVGLYFFITFEQTAITTIPPAETAQAFVLATPTVTPTPLPTATPSPEEASAAAAAIPSGQTVSTISHPIEGREDCLQCHALDGPLPFPADHEGRANENCQICHAPNEADPKPLPAVISHGVEGREACTNCHPSDTQPESHQELAFSDDQCLECHNEPLTQEQAVAETVSVITHPIEGREDCLQCHALDGPVPFPENHEGRPVEDCQFCHVPEGEQPQPAAAEISHTIEGREACTNCHPSDTQPESHQTEDFADEQCLQCHQMADSVASQ